MAKSTRKAGTLTEPDMSQAKSFAGMSSKTVLAEAYVARRSSRPVRLEGRPAIAEDWRP
jgi:hypothetical protein